MELVSCDGCDDDGRMKAVLTNGNRAADGKLLKREVKHRKLKTYLDFFLLKNKKSTMPGYACQGPRED